MINWTNDQAASDSATLDYSIGISGAVIAVRVHVLRWRYCVSLRAYANPESRPSMLRSGVEIKAMLPPDASDAKIADEARQGAQYCADLLAKVD